MFGNRAGFIWPIDGQCIGVGSACFGDVSGSVTVGVHFGPVFTILGVQGFFISSWCSMGKVAGGEGAILSRAYAWSLLAQGI
jgi:hypothetical protein